MAIVAIVIWTATVMVLAWTLRENLRARRANRELARLLVKLQGLDREPRR